MNQRFRPELEASAELEDAALWYERKRRGLGVEFVPNDVPARRWPVNRFPYSVIYLEWHDVVRILAFAHDSREPGFWFSRIDP